MTDYYTIRSEVRALAMSLPPSDFGSARAIDALADYVLRKISGQTVGPFEPYKPPRRRDYVISEGEGIGTEAAD